MGIKEIFENIGKMREANIEARRGYLQVQKAIRDKKLEEEARPIADEYSVDIDAAKVYVAKNKKVEQRKAGFKRLIENMGEFSVPTTNVSVSDELTLKPKVKPVIEPIKAYPKPTMIMSTHHLKAPEVKLPRLELNLKKRKWEKN